MRESGDGSDNGDVPLCQVNLLTQGYVPIVRIVPTVSHLIIYISLPQRSSQ